MPGGKNSKSLSPKYNARSVSASIGVSFFINNKCGGLLTHHEEVPREGVLVQVVVRQIEHFEDGKGSEAARQRVQAVDRDVQDAELRH